MDYSWLEVIKKSLDSLDRLASILKAASAGGSINDSELRMIVGEIEENSSRISRLLSFEKGRKVAFKYNITAHELGILTTHIGDDIWKSLLRGDNEIFSSVADMLSESTQLWRERIIIPAEMEVSVLERADVKQIQQGELPANPRVLLLLGAGASQPFHIPTMADFWKMVLADLRSDEEQFVMNMLLEAAKDETTHLPPDLERFLLMLDRYESYFQIFWEDPHFGMTSNWLTYAVPYQRIWPWNHHETPLEQSMRRCFRLSRGVSTVRDKVLKIMNAFYTMQFNREEITGLYEPIFSSINNNFKNNSISIFTTNYDTAIEQYCRYNGLELIDGFQKMGPSLIWNPVEYYQKQDPSQKTITLFKLHGSFTWRKIGNEIFQFGMSAERMPGDKALIYPTETKEYPYEEPFKTAYKFLDRFLGTAEIVIVIGYSFRDRGITYIIDEAQSSNPNLKFIIVCGENPEDDTRKRFPFGSHVIELNFKPGENPKYLAKLNELISEILKTS